MVKHMRQVLYIGFKNKPGPFSLPAIGISRLAGADSARTTGRVSGMLCTDQNWIGIFTYKHAFG